MSLTKKPKEYPLNLSPSYWKSRFLYPYALDPAPIKLNDAKQTNKEIIEEKKR
jgi:hypothetical protein